MIIQIHLNKNVCKYYHHYFYKNKKITYYRNAQRATMYSDIGYKIPKENNNFLQIHKITTTVTYNNYNLKKLKVDKTHLHLEPYACIKICGRFKILLMLHI